jgi:Asp-tRNA(Asn)/Glu-tRNA(Gln) amidotransferase A subunit family amidase
VPTVPFAAPLRARYPLAQRRRLSIWTRPFNVTDSAVFSLPLAGTRLPLGVQVVANDEATAITAATFVERAIHERRALASRGSGRGGRPAQR